MPKSCFTEFWQYTSYLYGLYCYKLFPLRLHSYVFCYKLFSTFTKPLNKLYISVSPPPAQAHYVLLKFWIFMYTYVSHIKPLLVHCSLRRCVRCSWFLLLSPPQALVTYSTLCCFWVNPPPGHQGRGWVSSGTWKGTSTAKPTGASGWSHCSLHGDKENPVFVYHSPAQELLFMHWLKNSPGGPGSVNVLNY